MKDRDAGRLVLEIVALALALMLKLLPAQHFVPDPSPSQQVTSVSYCAPFGGHRSVSLEDGTAVDLNTGTCVTPSFTENQRLVRLSPGEAIFNVVHDSDRPFVVQTPHHAIKDVGTKFDVYVTKVKMRVAVLEGVVEISTLDAVVSQGSVGFGAAQQIDIPYDRPEVRLVKRLDASEMRRATAWLGGNIELDRGSLGDLLAEFQRYQRVHFITRDRWITSLQVGGLFKTDKLDDLLGALRAQCIRVTTRDEAGLRIVTLSGIAGKRVGADCR